VYAEGFVHVPVNEVELHDRIVLSELAVHIDDGEDEEMELIGDVLDGLDSTRITRPCEGEKMTMEPVDNPNAITVSELAESDRSGCLSAASCNQRRAVALPSSRVYCATACHVFVS
jgi:hypothetical protein